MGVSLAITHVNIFESNSAGSEQSPREEAGSVLVMVIELNKDLETDSASLERVDLMPFGQGTYFFDAGWCGHLTKHVG